MALKSELIILKCPNQRYAERLWKIKWPSKPGGRRFESCLRNHNLTRFLQETGCFSAYMAVLGGKMLALKKGNIRENDSDPCFDP